MQYERDHSLNNSHWKRLLTCRRTDNEMNECLQYDKGKEVTLSHYRPGKAFGLLEVEAIRISRQWEYETVRLSAVDTGRLYPEGYISGTHFC